MRVTCKLRVYLRTVLILFHAKYQYFLSTLRSEYFLLNITEKVLPHNNSLIATLNFSVFINNLQYGQFKVFRINIYSKK